MRFFLKYILLCFVVWGVSLHVEAQEETFGLAVADHEMVDSGMVENKAIKVSLLTCTAGDELYSKFGHTALLVHEEGEKDGMVFNYGCFNSDDDDFAIKFLYGQTDYVLGCEPYKEFIARYKTMGVGVFEQELNLTEDETIWLLAILSINSMPQNQEYRYNWLYNNCTEKARDVVEMAVVEDVLYKKAETNITVREMLRKCLKNDLWKSFGIDMILGEEIDKPTDRRIRMFLPEYYKEEMAEAYKQDVPLVKSERQIIEAKNIEETPSFLLSPTFVFGLLLIAVCFISVYEYRRRQNYVYLDVLLHTLQGIAGLLVAFLFFLSEHPAVDSNWLVIIFNPIPLFYAVWLVYCKRAKRGNVLAYTNFVILAGFLITMALCRQSFCIAMYLLVFALLMRALSQSINAYRKIR